MSIVAVADFEEQNRGGYAAASAWTGLCRGTLRALVSRNQIPHRRLAPRLVVFDRDELERWMRGRDLLARSRRNRKRKP